ncbi:MAG: tetratricopeptide repeat protein, partial [Candidatus Aureabacteria bacterium]|nr:tetratricopeptide repeat protein [Candidatus Auribacterota bacterium]
MKKLTRILTIIIPLVLLSGVGLFFLLQKKMKRLPSSRENVYKVLQEGIDNAKKRSFPEAHSKFKEAEKILRQDEHVFFSLGDIAEFPSLINEFKTFQQEWAISLFQMLPNPLQVKITQLKTSQELDTAFETEFIQALNKNLMRSDFTEKLALTGEDRFPRRIRLLIRSLRPGLPQPDPQAVIRDPSFVYYNRLFLAGALPQFFPQPLTELEIKMNEALAYFSERKIIQAEDILKDVIRKQPLYIKAYLLLARIEENKGNLDKAIEILQEAIKIVPDDENVLTELAVYYKKSGKPEKAKELLESVLQLNPNNFYAIQGLHVLERNTRKNLQSSAYYRTLAGGDPKNIIHLSNLALALLKEKKISESYESVKKGLMIQPTDGYLLKIKGRLEGIRQNYRQAVEDLLKAKKYSAGSDKEIYLLLGITYFNQQLNEEAYQTLNEGLVLFPNEKHFLYNLAMVCEVMPDHRKEALEHYQNYLRLYPESDNREEINNKIKNLQKS